MYKVGFTTKESEPELEFFKIVDALSLRDAVLEFRKQFKHETKKYKGQKVLVYVKNLRTGKDRYYRGDIGKKGGLKFG